MKKHYINQEKELFYLVYVEDQQAILGRSTFRTGTNPQQHDAQQNRIVVIYCGSGCHAGAYRVIVFS